jgi:hypothetical protein
MPTSNILYRILWVQENERRARIVNPAENKLWMQQGLNPWLQGERPAPKPLNHKDSYILRASFFHLNLLPLSLNLTCITPEVPSRRLQSEHALVPITSFRTLPAGRRTLKNKAICYGFEGVFMGLDYGKSKYYVLIRIMGVTLVTDIIFYSQL